MLGLQKSEEPCRILKKFVNAYLTLNESEYEYVTELISIGMGENRPEDTLLCGIQKRHLSPAECDISVSKLLGFETFPFFLWYRYRFRKFLVSKKSIGIGFEKNLVLKNMNLFQNYLVKKILKFKKS